MNLCPLTKPNCGNNPQHNHTKVKMSTWTETWTIRSNYGVDDYGGYDYKFCDPLPDECPCTVCTLVQKDPHQLICCGKIFCKSCLDELIKHNKSCPNCRGDFIRSKKYFPDVNTDRKIKHFRIHCKNERQGCTWIGCLKDLEGSHVPMCPFELVPCTNKRTNDNGATIRDECGALVQQSDLQKHMTKKCEWRQVMCVHCNFTSSSFNYIRGQHIKKCPSTPIACDNEGCHEKVKRNLTEQHQATCPHVIVSCRYSSVGCEQKIKRQDIQTHNKECMEEHLDNAVSTLESELKRIKKLKDCIKELEAKNKSKVQNHEEYKNKTASMMMTMIIIIIIMIMIISSLSLCCCYGLYTRYITITYTALFVNFYNLCIIITTVLIIGVYVILYC